MRDFVPLPIPILESRYRSVEMNYFSTAIAGLFVILTAAFAVYLAVAITHNLKVGMHYRQGIVRQLSKLRLARMLGIHGIDQDAYVHTQPVLEIRDQMKHCSECTGTEQCDKLLDEGIGDKSGFCANDEALSKVSKKLGPAS